MTPATRVASRYLSAMRNTIVVPHAKPATTHNILQHGSIKRMFDHLEKHGWVAGHIQQVSQQVKDEIIYPLKIMRPSTRTTFRVTMTQTGTGITEPITIREDIQPFYPGDYPDTGSYVLEGDNHGYSFDYGPIIEEQFDLKPVDPRSWIKPRK